jgi:hypothetical protein
MKPLTAPQTALLARVRAEGEVRLNGRARRTVEALEAAGLVTYEYDLQPSAGAWTELFIVRPA